MKQIPLSAGRVALVSDKDYKYLMQWRWSYSPSGAMRKENGRTIYMHRVIMNTPDELEVDHKDHDRCNNQRYNLRNCTHSQNLMNGRKQSNNTTGYKGVQYLKRDKKWRAHITFQGQFCHLGNFELAEDAARAYDEAAHQKFGKYAVLNFPNDYRPRTI